MRRWQWILVCVWLVLALFFGWHLGYAFGWKDGCEWGRIEAKNL